MRGNMRACCRWILMLGMVWAADAVRAAPACIWLEGEVPAQANFQYEVQSWSPLFSGGAWLHVSRDAAEAKHLLAGGALVLRYELSVPRAGACELWARIGYEWMRAPFQWRFNGGPQTAFGADAQTTNVMALGADSELAWAKLGVVAVREGANTVEFRYAKVGPDGRLLIGLDCLALVEGEGNFTPEGALKPRAQYATELDRAAGEHVFAWPGALPESRAARAELPLDGLWQVARYDDPDMDRDPYVPVWELPTPAEYELRWMGIQIPGDARARQELRFGHRLLYRARVDVPEALRGRAFHLQFSGTNWIAGVFVNDQYVGGRQSVLVPWDLDVTRAVRPGQVNTIIVSVKSSWYALQPREGESLDLLRNLPYEGDLKRRCRFVDAIYPSTKGEGDGLQVGLVKPVKLVASGPAYTSDVFIKTSVARRALQADVTVRNATSQAAIVAVRCEAVNAKTDEVEQLFGPVAFSVSADSAQTVTLGDEWADAKLWWPERDPDLYLMRTTVTQGDEPTDVHEELFGFREVTVEGKYLMLNGIPWHFWNWADVGGAATEEEWLRDYEAGNNRLHRASADQDGLWRTREEALGFFDRQGVPVRLSTCIDGTSITHDLRNPLVWRNFESHVRQVVLAYRNHPSVLMYSVGNDLIFVTAKLAYGPEEFDRWMEKTHAICEAARELDPTRPGFEDGAGDLNRRGAVSCVHYSRPQGPDVPAALYRYPVRSEKWTPEAGSQHTQAPFVWDGQRPLILGEEFLFPGGAAGLAWFGGPDVYRGEAFAREAAARYVRMAIEGARWQGVAVICPATTLPEAGPALAPRAVVVREHNACFASGSTLERTIKVFNDGRSEEPLTLRWRVTVGGREVASAEKAYDIPPGRDYEDVLVVDLPEVQARTEGALDLELSAGGAPVFNDSKGLCVVPEPGVDVGLDARALCVYDPEGSALGWLEERGQACSPLGSLADIPEAAGVLLIGRGALTADRKGAEAQVIAAFVRAGKTAIVLEQEHPLAGDELPVPGIRLAGERPDQPADAAFAAAGGQSGCIAFPVAVAHPVLKGLEPRDLFTWGDGEAVFRLSYSVPSSGAISLVQAGERLRLAPLLDVPVGQGHYLLCQMLVASKLGAEPAADRLFRNMLAWSGSGLRLASRSAKAAPFAPSGE